MTISRSSQIGRFVASCAAFCLFTLGSITVAAEPTDTVRRFDPRTRELVPIDPKDAVPGKIYNHYDPQHGRYVWAYSTEGGGFSYPLGPGTIESPHNFDLVTSEQETEQLLEAEIGEWADAIRREGSEIMVEQQADGRWQVLANRSIRSHYDLNTGRRWEWHGPNRKAVSHTNGYTWRFVGDRYVPANPWLGAGAACGCCSY